MKKMLFYNTVTPLLHSTLIDLMKAKEFEKFRLVGGTSLSLQIGHRMSIDIDMFTDALYDTIDFGAIESYLRTKYLYVDTNSYGIVGTGTSYYIGESKENNVKLDLYYTDKYIQDFLLIDGIRLASKEEIIAMKMDVISRGGRKKDFWDIHAFLSDYSFEDMIDLYKERHPYTADEKEIRENFTSFRIADKIPKPDCLKNKEWEAIKLDLIDFATS
jgi:hypothetical protein